MKTALKSFALIFFLFSILPLTPAIGADAVIVSGEAAASQPDARDQALKSAFRAAIEQNVGVQVSSETISQNSAILKDEIYAFSEGFIEKWEIQEEKVDQDMLTLTVKAWVREGQLNKSLFINGLDVNKVYTWIGEPRVLIMMQESVDGKPSEMGIAQTELENLFIEKGIDVFNQMQLSDIRERDKALSFKDAKTAVTLGKRYGAEIVVAGKCITNFSRELEIGQFKMNFYSTVMQIRAYSTATGKLIHSANYTSDKTKDTSAMGKFDAALNSIKATVGQAKSDILFNIVKNWYDGFSKPKTYQVMVHGVDYASLEKLKQKFYGFEGFQKLHVRSYANDIAELDIKYESLRGDFIRDVINRLPYRIIRQEQNRIDLERKKK